MAVAVEDKSIQIIFLTYGNLGHEVRETAYSMFC
jgi:hypothetical protein